MIITFRKFHSGFNKKLLVSQRMFKTVTITTPVFSESEFTRLACRLMVQLRVAEVHVRWKRLPGWW